MVFSYPVGSVSNPMFRTMNRLSQPGLQIRQPLAGARALDSHRQRLRLSDDDNQPLASGNGRVEEVALQQPVVRRAEWNDDR